MSNVATVEITKIRQWILQNKALLLNLKNYSHFCIIKDCDSGLLLWNSEGW